LSKTTSHKRNKLAGVCIWTGRLLVLASIALGLVYGLGYAMNSKAATARFKASRIVYEGTRYLDERALHDLLRRSLPENLLKADLGHLRRIVEAEPWVKDASVRRRLPDLLLVSIVEREPAATAIIDGELFVVDPEGVILDRYGPRYDSLDGPLAVGLQNMARENAREANAARMHAYLRVLGDFRSPQRDYSQAISEINVENIERVAVIPANDTVPVYLGNDRFLQRFQTFLSSRELYDEVKLQYGQIEYVDVSFENKIIFHTPKSSQSKARPRSGV
jgi:cell division protein FtsQ